MRDRPKCCATDPEIARQRQTLGTLSFAAHNDLASTPVEIVELKRGDFGHSHAKTDQHWQNGDVAAAIPRSAMA